MSSKRMLPATAIAVLAASLALSGWAWVEQSSGQQEHLTSSQLVDSLRPGLNDEQAVALADGVLTREEYDAARDRVAACLEGNGLTVHREPGRGPGGVDEIWAESPATAGNLSDAFRNCYERYQGKLSMVWAEQNRPTSDQLAARERAVDVCMTSKGFDPQPLDEFWGKDADRASAYMKCLAEVGPPTSTAR